MERRTPCAINPFNTISGWIADFASAPESRGEMLPKTPQELEAIHKQGLSHILLENGRPIAHAALWPLIDTEEIKLFEFGSWITDPSFRHYRLNGMTAGELAAFNLLRQIDLTQIAVTATIKRKNTEKGLRSLGGLPISFHNFPFITGLTCTCNGSDGCSYRRRPNYGETVIPLSNGNRIIYQHEDSFTLPTESLEPPKLPCTLIGFSLPTLAKIEKELGRLFVETFGHPLCNNGPIDQSTMTQLKVFYQQIGVNL